MLIIKNKYLLYSICRIFSSYSVVDLRNTSSLVQTQFMRFVNKKATVHFPKRQMQLEKKIQL